MVAQASLFFLQEHEPVVALPQDGFWQQAAAGVLLVLPSLALGAGVSAAMARDALNVSAAIMVGMRGFVVLWWISLS